MKAAILGNGNLGTALANHLLRRGHAVAWGVRDAASPSVAKAMAACPGTTATTAAQAVSDADVVFVALPWLAALPAMAPLATTLTGKTVVDCTNAYVVANGYVKPFALPSAAELMQRCVPGAKVVKAFNQLGAAKLANPQFVSGTPWMGVAGDDSEAVHRVVALAQSFGFNAVPFGKLSAAVHLEDMARIWIHAVYVAGMGPGIGFALLNS